MIECNITGTIYSVYHWADVPESEDTYWSSLSSGKEYWKHPLPHASPSEVRDSCYVAKWGFGLVGFWLVVVSLAGCFFFLCLLLAALQFSQSMKIKIIFFIKKGDNFRFDKALFLSIDKQSSSILQMGTCLTAHLCDHWISSPLRTKITNESSPASMISKLIRR